MQRNIYRSTEILKMNFKVFFLMLLVYYLSEELFLEQILAETSIEEPRSYR